MKIKDKFINFFIVFGILPIVISSGVSIGIIHYKNIEIMKQNAINQTYSNSTSLGYFFQQNVSDLKMIADMSMVKTLLSGLSNESDIEKDKKILNEILRARKDEQFYYIAGVLINSEGNVITASDDKYGNVKNEFSAKELEALSRNQVVVTDIIKRPDFGHSEKCAIIANPIFFEDKYHGAIISVINMKYFENIVKEEENLKNIYLMVMDTSGRIAVSTNKDVIENMNETDIYGNLYEQWRGMDAYGKQNGIIEYSVDGIERIVYYSKINDTNWITFSEVKWTEIKQPMYKVLSDIIIFFICILTIIITFYTFIINHFSKPMYELLQVIRKIGKGNYKDRFIYNVNNEFGEIAAAFNDLIDIVEKNKKYIEEKNRNLQSITTNIPGGVCKWIIKDEKYFLSFISAGGLKLLGYKNREFKQVYHTNLMGLIHEKDRERVVREIKKQLSDSNKYTIEYRIYTKDKSIIWVLDNGQIVKSKDGGIINYSVIINITDSKITQEKLRLSEQRYSIIMSQSEDIIFEWNVISDTMNFSENWKKKFKHELVMVNFSKKIYKTDIIFKDDKKRFREVLNNMIGGKPYEHIEIRLKIEDDKYIWCKLRITSIFDENRNIIKTIGVIIDIHKEKMEAEKLLYKVQRDGLTGLYNKETVQNMIEEYIKNEGLNTKGALFIIDVDNFKGINDNLGHLAGDYVLSSIGSMISNVFSENSIAGRIGGDEFIIYLKDISSYEFVSQKADELVEAFRENAKREDFKYKVSGSIGIAKYPEDGNEFKELFRNADKAVYLSKNKGKDNYSFFDEI